MTENALQIFKNEEFGAIRAVEIDGEVWFVGKDVAEALGYSNPQKAVRDHVDESDRGVNEMVTPGGKQQIPIINESGVYSLIFGSKLESARRFKHWVTVEVLPAIRRHGAYMTPDVIEKSLTNPDFIIRLATELKQEQAKLAAEKARNAQLETKVWQDAPKVALADAIVASETSVSMATLAKLITQNGHEIGQRRLFDWMRVNGWLIRSGNDKNKPTQKSMKKGLFEVHEHVLYSRYGTSRIIRTTKVTGKGQQFFINKFMHPEEKGYTV